MSALQRAALPYIVTLGHMPLQQRCCIQFGWCAGQHDPRIALVAGAVMKPAAALRRIPQTTPRHKPMPEAFLLDLPSASRYSSPAHGCMNSVCRALSATHGFHSMALEPNSE
jgi:hypothetical protein